MSLRKKLNIVCILLAIAMIVVIFLPTFSGVLANGETLEFGYWGTDDHSTGIMYIFEFVCAIVMYLIFHFGALKDNRIALLFLGDYLFNNIVVFFKLIGDNLAVSCIYGYWVGLVLIIALVAATIVSNYVTDKAKPRKGFNPQYGPGPYNNNNMYNNQPPMYNNQPPMGYNNYR